MPCTRTRRALACAAVALGAALALAAPAHAVSVDGPECYTVGVDLQPTPDLHLSPHVEGCTVPNP